MKISTAKSAGFCFGVKRALTIARQTACARANVCMLGDIVHNEDVVRDIEQSGIKKIKKLRNGRGKTLLIRAHGSATAVYDQARRRGYRIIDATCPMVKEIHTIARSMEAKGCVVIVIGDKEHDEVRGIVGQLKTKAVVIDNADKIPHRALAGVKKAAIVVQSTQKLEKVMEIVESVRKDIPGVIFHNTICRPTRIKQEEIRLLPRKSDVIIIIGSKYSANTRRLYEISRDSNPQSYWVHDARRIKRAWFKGARSVGITAGASTPETTIQDVIAKIHSLS